MMALMGENLVFLSTSLIRGIPPRREFCLTRLATSISMLNPKLHLFNYNVNGSNFTLLIRVIPQFKGQPSYLDDQALNPQIIEI